MTRATSSEDLLFLPTQIHRTDAEHVDGLNPVVSLLPPGLSPRPGPFLLSYSVFVFIYSPYFFVSVPCARLSCPSRQLLLSAC